MRVNPAGAGQRRPRQVGAAGNGAPHTVMHAAIMARRCSELARAGRICA
jgi:hypothetical protein